MGVERDREKGQRSVAGSHIGRRDDWSHEEEETAERSIQKMTDRQADEETTKRHKDGRHWISNYYLLVISFIHSSTHTHTDTQTDTQKTKLKCSHHIMLQHSYAL